MLSVIPAEAGIQRIIEDRRFDVTQANFALKRVDISEHAVGRRTKRTYGEDAPLVRPRELSYTVYLMCLAVPALITKIDGVMADAELAGNQTSVNILFTPEAKVGDYVIMHAGYAISVMNSAEAEETFQLLEEMAGLDAEE